MPRPIQYLFCKYGVMYDGSKLDAAAEFNLLSENQGKELNHYRLMPVGFRLE